MLRSVKLLWVVLSLLVIATAANAMEEVSVDATLDYVGKFIWRGKVVTDDPALQPGVTVGMDKLTMGVWGSVDMTSVNEDRNEFQRVHYNLDYTDALPCVEGVSYSVGGMLYQLPTTHGTDNATSEIYAGLGFDTILNPTATLYYDFDDVHGYYASLGISHSLDISELGLLEDMANSLDLAASVGYGDRDYNQKYWTDSVDALNDLVISATLPIKLCEAATLNASCNYVSLLDGSLDVDGIGTKKTQKGDYVYAGIGLAVSF